MLININRLIHECLIFLNYLIFCNLNFVFILIFYDLLFSIMSVFLLIFHVRNFSIVISTLMVLLILQLFLQLFLVITNSIVFLLLKSLLAVCYSVLRRFLSISLKSASKLIKISFGICLEFQLHILLFHLQVFKVFSFSTFMHDFLFIKVFDEVLNFVLN